MGKRWVYLLIAAFFCFVLSESAKASSSGFVKVNGTRFELNGAPYYFLGTNFWYGMNLGSPGRGGDRPRLIRELDRLKKLGVLNLRILAASEGPEDQPWRIVPAIQHAPGQLNEDLLLGLDFLLDEMRARDMKAVIILNNFWPWSGGMAQYLSWVNKSAIPYPPPHPGGDWSVYQAYTAAFYSNRHAMDLANGFLWRIINRTNAYSNIKYTDDPAIMAWQLANEPRGVNNVEAFNKWINVTSRTIKAVDKNHLVSVGVEGDTPNPVSAGMEFVRNSSHPAVDYATIHIWAQNWSWYDPVRHDATFERAVRLMEGYINSHLFKARMFKKPVVVEEFGLGRDRDSYDWKSRTKARDAYYSKVFETIYQAAKKGLPVAGVNFWAWAGEGRPSQPKAIWSAGAPFIGDPPHEHQGWYSVYDTDKSTQDIISDYAVKMSGIR